MLVCCAVLMAGPACGQREAEKPVDMTKYLEVRVGIDKDAAVEGTPFFRKTIVTRPYKLRPWLVNYHAEPFKVKPFSTEEDVYITHWRSNTEEPDGTRSPDDIHCHTYLADSFPRQTGGWLFRGVFTDGFTPEFTLPEGYGVRVPKGESFRFLPMFNNRRPDARQAVMRVEVDYIPASRIPKDKPLTELRAFTLSSAEPDTYWVRAREKGEPPLRDVKKAPGTFPVSGRVHAIGAHLHPGGRTVELKRMRDKKVLHTARLVDAELLEHQRLTNYISEEGFFIRRGERILVTTIYENASYEKIDAMGGIFVFYDPKGRPDE